MLPPYARARDGGLEIQVLVVPGASRAAVVGVHGDRLKVRVAEPPEDGRANRAVEALVATWAGVRRAEVVAGHGSRRKTMFVPDARSLPEAG